MKKLFVEALCLFMLMIPASFIKAQDTISAFDTLHLVHANYYLDNYSVDDSIITTISIHTSQIVRLNDIHFTVGGDILDGILALSPGVGIGNTKDVDWYMAALIRTNDPKLDWISDVYCPGYVKMRKVKTKKADGSRSVETEYENAFSWQKGALNFIIEAGDTVGWHYVYMDPRINPALAKWSKIVYKNKQGSHAINYKDFALLGEFLGKESAILYSSKENMFYLFAGNQLLGKYQCQKPKPLISCTRKERKVIQPYLLVNHKLGKWERVDILRLTMVGLRMKNAIVSD